MKFIDLYAGIGGFRYALESFGNECVFSAEINKPAIETYKKNFGDDPTFNMDLFAEMSDKDLDLTVPDHDILVGGFPCQPFSIGGKKEGFNTEDTKGTQFFNILRILEVKKPKYVILENVKHLVKHDFGKTYKVILEELRNLGYTVPDQPILLSPVQLGIPQRRDRVFITCVLGEELKEYVSPNKEVKPLKLDKIKATNLKEDDLFYLKAWEEFIKNVSRTDTGTIPTIWLDEMISNFIDEEWQDWKLNYVSKMRQFYKNNKKFIDTWINKYDALNWPNRRNRKLEWSAGDEDSSLKDKHIVIRESGFRVRKGIVFPTQVASVETPIIFDENINEFRKLTKREISRLQSFPAKHKPNDNDYQAYKQYGNAVNVEVIKWIYKEMMK